MKNSMLKVLVYFMALGALLCVSVGYADDGDIEYSEEYVEEYQPADELPPEENDEASYSDSDAEESVTEEDGFSSSKSSSKKDKKEIVFKVIEGKSKSKNKF